jgi:hypothetical protein
MALRAQQPEARERHCVEGQYDDLAVGDTLQIAQARSPDWKSNSTNRPAGEAHSAWHGGVGLAV